MARRVPTAICGAAAAALIATTAPPAAADLRVQFLEGAPRDRFVIHNEGACGLAAPRLTIDLGPSAGGLFFDTDIGGPGSNVTGAFEPIDDLARAATVSIVDDGATVVEMTFPGIPAGATTRFQFDADDSVTGSGFGTTVSGAEIVGATATLNDDAVAVFDAAGIVYLPAIDLCPVS